MATASNKASADDALTLRQKLLMVQLAAERENVPVVVLLSGFEGAGKGHVVNHLYDWMDTRNVQAHAFWDESDSHTQRPEYWRFWRVMPARGEIAVLFGGWYQRPLENLVLGKIDHEEFERQMQHARDFEKMLSEDGTLIIKLWYEFSESEQHRRIGLLKRDDRSRWKMFPRKSNLSEHYSRYADAGERIVRETGSDVSPWHRIDATDEEQRDLETARVLWKRIKARLKSGLPAPVPQSVGGVVETPVPTIEALDLDRKLGKDAYQKKLGKLQSEINELAWDAYKAGRSTIVLLEGADAAGKGGAIRRLTQSVDARLYRVIPIAAPSDEEHAHHYLWRFWRHIPRAGRMTIYDRSWYGRVLVERIEGFTPEARWRNGYAEINEFERQLSESGSQVIKFWVQISMDEQLRRFRAREETPHKQHKMTDEDWRNRDKWDVYRDAANEMFACTHSKHAPWQLVAGNDKRSARIHILRVIRDTLRESHR